jgi:hypothetical protein
MKLLDTQSQGYATAMAQRPLTMAWTLWLMPAITVSTLMLPSG